LKAQEIAANALRANSKVRVIAANVRPAGLKAQEIAANALRANSKAREIAANARPAGLKALVTAPNAPHAGSKTQAIATNAAPAATTANVARSADRAQAQAVRRKMHRVANARCAANATHPIVPVSAATVALPKTVAAAIVDRAATARRAVLKASVARPNVASAASRNP
jgi:hypothetical protein